MATISSADCWFLVGPTASGKSTVGIALAQRLGAEIISLDSMALYRGMDIGTAKPTLEQQRQIPHHLVDILDPAEEYSLAQYISAAERCVVEICSRGRKPLFVGGTPLYLKGLLRGIFSGPPADPELRAQWHAAAQQHGVAYLHRQLAEVDAQAAARLHPNDTRRIIRALEVFAKTGRPISEWQQQFVTARPAAACRVFVLDWPRPELHRRIDQRVEAMFAAGLVDEVRRLLAGPAPLSKTARQAVGYREVIEHLAGRSAVSDALALVQQHTRQLAKRQMTWFRSLSECRFISLTGALNIDALAQQLAEF